MSKAPIWNGKCQAKDKNKIISAHEMNRRAEAEKFHFNEFIIHANLPHMEPLNHPGSLSVMGMHGFQIHAYTHEVDSRIIKCGCVCVGVIAQGRVINS